MTVFALGKIFQADTYDTTTKNMYFGLKVYKIIYNLLSEFKPGTHSERCIRKPK